MVIIDGLHLRFPSFFVFTLPEFHRRLVLEDPSVIRVDPQGTTHALGYVPELNEQGTFMSGDDV